MPNDSTGSVSVPVKSAWLSKINWTQGIGMAASLGVLFGIHVPPETQAAAITGIQAVSAVATWVIKTWFTKTVTPGSL